eukprot:GGOE01002541.1.p1 GENE.GGOE01002541.1~~GGOE01002541.1.p1  ORF type:complete len:232 (+),score=32.47 GGOE01002541.1:45-740(+)
MCQQTSWTKVDKPLRLLCLHGYQQSGALFSLSAQNLRQILHGVATLDFIDGYRPIEEASGPSRVAFTWWNAKRSPSGYCYHGKWQAVDYVLKRLLEQGPYDGILGFSQGAAMACLVTSIIHSDVPVPQVQLSTELRAELQQQLRFAIFIGGFRPRDPALQFIFAHPIPRIKTFHVIGATDDLVRPERSQELLSTFQNAEVLHHPQGHVIPMDRAAQLGYLRFLQQGLLSAL